MLNRLIILLCLPILFLSAVPVEENSENFTTGPAPAWVKPCDFNKEALPAQDSDVDYQFLLEDGQLNWEEKTHYMHRAIKVLNQAGAHNFTQLVIDFDPAYQHVIVHDIRVLRDGEIINCLEKSRHKLLQREDSLERNIYHGGLSLVYFLNDIRVGDVVEHSYSIVGVHSFLSSHFNHWVHLKWNRSLDKVYHRILIHPEHTLQFKMDDQTLAPKVVDLSPALQEWSWEVMHTSKSSEGKDVPIWHDLFDGSVQISQYKTWQEVAQKELPLYSLPDDFEANPPPEMLNLIKKWTESTGDAHQRALLALRFVQDQIKYLGFEDGLGGFKPTDPRVVLQQRFGDCKDKSVLLHSLLKLMKINSAPVMVNTGIGKKLPELLPTQYFNHVILQIEIEGSHYWVDPVYPYQGGSLQTTYCPEYHWGLVISPSTKELTAIPFPGIDKPVEIYTFITMTSPHTAELIIERTGYGFSAERIRGLLQQIGLKKYSDSCLEDAQNQYKSASLLFPISIVDDREKNVMTITESYKVSTRTRLGKKILKASSSVLVDYLDNGINLDRSSPYALSYPLWVKEHIHIENPFNDWAHDTEEAAFENEAIKYVYHMKKEGHAADFDFEIKHLQDHVPVDLIEDYWNLVQEVEPNPSLEVVILNAPH